MNKLRQLRNEANLTALQLAQAADCKEQQIYAYERGRYNPPAAVAHQLAMALGSIVSEMFPDMANDGGRE